MLEEPGLKECVFSKSVCPKGISGLRGLGLRILGSTIRTLGQNGNCKGIIGVRIDVQQGLRSFGQHEPPIVVGIPSPIPAKLYPLQG